MSFITAIVIGRQVGC